jgi:cell division protein FtsB
MTTPAAALPRRDRTKTFLMNNWPRLAISFALLAVFFGNQGFRSLVRNYIELRSLKKDLVALENEERHSSERLKLLRSGDVSVERMARRELGYVRKGEIEYRFPPPAPEK